MGTEQLCIKWSDHQSNLTSIFEKFFSTESLVDVTLACEGLSLNAHKIVLSASSPYFQTLFLKNPCKHPIVIMQDTKYAELKAIIDFMYKGEINIPHHQLSGLLKTAEVLKVKGLIDVAEENNNQSTSLDIKIHSTTTIPENVSTEMDNSSLNTSSPLTSYDQTNVLCDSNNVEEVPSEMIETTEIIEAATIEIINESLIDTNAQIDNSSADQTSALTINESLIDISQCIPSEIETSSPNTTFESSVGQRKGDKRKSNISDNSDDVEEISSKTDKSESSQMINKSYSESDSFLDKSVTDVSIESTAAIESTSESISTFIEESPSNNVSHSPVRKRKNKMIKISSDIAEESKVKQCKSSSIIKDPMRHITESTLSIPIVDIAHKIDLLPYIKKEIEDPPPSPDCSIIEEITIEKKVKIEKIPLFTESDSIPSSSFTDLKEQTGNNGVSASINSLSGYNSNFITQVEFPQDISGITQISNFEMSTDFNSSQTDVSSSIINSEVPLSGTSNSELGDLKETPKVEKSDDEKNVINEENADFEDKKPYNTENMKYHVKTHAGKKLFACDICGKKFIRKCYFQNHLKSHSFKKTFQCDLCKKVYKCKKSLVIHFRSHTGERPFSCNICYRDFSRKRDLIIHTRIHTGEKPYTCNVCHLKFAERKSLITHIRIHTGEKPYTCKVCNRSFRQRSHLKYHILTHSEKEPFDDLISFEGCTNAVNVTKM